MPRRRCPVCAHPEARAITAELLAGTSTTGALASHFRVHPADVRTHANKCKDARGRVYDPAEAGPVATTETISARLVTGAMDMAHARRTASNEHVAIKATAEERQNLMAVHELVMADQAASGAALEDMGALLSSPAFRELATLMETVLEPYPDALAALVQALTHVAAAGTDPAALPPAGGER